MHATTLALVGATGGAGTTRTAVELAALGARDGRDVAVIDAAFTTQGLSEYVTGRIETDCTALVTDSTGASLSAAAYPLAVGGESNGDRLTGVDSGADLRGRVDAIPAYAPFERMARAKTAEAAQKLSGRIDDAATAYDAVIVDAAPVGSNEAVGAVTAADRVEAVYPATTHGKDALQRLRGRIADIGSSVDGSIAIARDGASQGGLDSVDNDAEILLPKTEPAVASAPVTATGTGAYTQAIADAYASVFDTSIGIEFDESGVLDRLRS